MNRLLTDIKHLTMSEYNRAAEKFGACNNSDHESYAVIKEEVEEAAEEVAFIDAYLENFWQECKQNEPMSEKLHNLKMLMEHAQLGAAELIQVAAMAYKAVLTVEERRNK